MPAQILMEPPRWLWDAIGAGRAIVKGAMVKDSASGRILAHLQASRSLAQVLAQSASVAAGVPNLLGQAAQIVQLEQVKSMLSTLQVIAGVGAAASVLNLGVSVGGFALVLRRLGQIQNQLSQLDERIVATKAVVQRAQLADVLVALERCEQAFTFSDPDRIWLEEERVLQRHFVYVLLGLFGDDAVTSGPANAVWSTRDLNAEELAHGLAWPMLCMQARIEALLLARQPAAARAACADAEQWLSRLTVDPAAYVRNRSRLTPLGPERQERLLTEARELKGLLDGCRTQAESSRTVCEVLISRGIDSRAYVEEVRGVTEPVVLVLEAAKES